VCELQAHGEGGEADKDGHMEEGIRAPGARYVGEHVVVRALGGYGPLFVVADFFLEPQVVIMPNLFSLYKCSNGVDVVPVVKEYAELKHRGWYELCNFILFALW
jgi:hypothetical protein